VRAGSIEFRRRSGSAGRRANKSERMRRCADAQIRYVGEMPLADIHRLAVAADNETTQYDFTSPSSVSDSMPACGKRRSISA